MPFLHPPRAAFAAADIEGIYFQAELPLWGSISPDNHRLNDFLLNEAYMTLDYMGNHPSFTMLGLGNELGGDVDLMRNWLDGFRKHDNRHLYSLGSNNFLGWGGAIDGEDYLTTCRVGGGEGYTTHVRSSFAFVDAEKGGILNNTRPNTPCGLYCCHSEISPDRSSVTKPDSSKIYPDYKDWRNTPAYCIHITWRYSVTGSMKMDCRTRLTHSIRPPAGLPSNATRLILNTACALPV